MQPKVVALLLVFVGLALCQPAPPTQPNLYPIWDSGIETVWLNDISFATEISFQTYGQSNWSAYVYGDRRIRTVYLHEHDWFVGATPNENWHLPFIDIHTFQNGSDVWGVGPVNALYARNRTAVSGFQFEIAVVSTKLIPDNPRGRIFVEQPLGFEGTFYSVRLAGFDGSSAMGGHAYFAGFFPSNESTTTLNFGVRRGWFNNSLFDGNQSWNISNAAWSSTPGTDDAILYNNAQLVTYSSEFKPILIHAWNITGYPANTTFLVVVDPYTNFANLITGNFNPAVPLNKTEYHYVPVFGSHQFGRIVSAVAWQDLLFVGVSVDGQGTGWIDVLNIANLTKRAYILLPTNYSDPRALVLDWFDPTTPTLYVGPNGGWALLKIDINTLTIVGYQNLPYYLHRTWRGMTTPNHTYFITNEQNAKVYRLRKDDFCRTPCMENGYCEHGRCVCNQYTVQKGPKCEWKEIVIEKHIAHRDKGGEIALGIFFAIAVIAAAAGWYMVWKNRRGYQAVN